MPVMDVNAVADAILSAHATRQAMTEAPSSMPGFDLPMAYAVERELVRRRLADGAKTAGRKVAYANKAMWRVLKLDTVLWAHMYDDTVRTSVDNRASLSIAAMYAPKIEPEIVFKLAAPLPDGASEPTAILAAVEWFALGFEIIDCVYPDWKFQPVDFVASFGLHAALIVGEPTPLASADRAALGEQLARFTVRLDCDGQIVADGGGRNVLRSPALALGELAAAVARQPDTEPLAAGEFVSSGTLTESQFIAPGQTWTATVAGLDLRPISIRIA